MATALSAGDFSLATQTGSTDGFSHTLSPLFVLQLFVSALFLWLVSSALSGGVKFDSSACFSSPIYSNEVELLLYCTEVLKGCICTLEYFFTSTFT